MSDSNQYKMRSEKYKYRENESGVCLKIHSCLPLSSVEVAGPFTIINVNLKSLEPFWKE